MNQLIIANQWLGVLAWHLLPVFYRLYLTTTNKKKTFHPILQNKPLQLPKFIMKDIKEYK
jgi:hypothetical protein